MFRANNPEAQIIGRRNGTGKFGLPKIAVALLVAHTLDGTKSTGAILCGEMPHMKVHLNLHTYAYIYAP
jgi:hypothetical protein